MEKEIQLDSSTASVFSGRSIIAESSIVEDVKGNRIDYQGLTILIIVKDASG